MGNLKDMIFKEQDSFGKLYGVYRITNIYNGKVYVGQTREGFNRRFWLHNHLLSNNKHDNWNLQQDYDKYGTDSFVFDVVECHDKEDVAEINAGEYAWVLHYKNKGLAYNILDGGPGAPGVHLSEETKRKIGEKNRINMTGRKASEETKRKMSATRKGRIPYPSLVVNDPVIVRKIKELLITGMSAPDVAKTLNVKYKLVNEIISNNSWSTVQVDGWDEFFANRQKKYTRTTPEEYYGILEDYKKGLTNKELAKKYNKEIHTINNYIAGRKLPKFAK